MTDIAAQRTPVAGRGGLFLALAIIAVVNGFAAVATQSVVDSGWARSAVATFEISVVLWFAAAVAFTLLRADAPREPIRSLDGVVAAAVLLLAVLPAARIAWLGVSLLAVYMLLTVPRRTRPWRAAVVMLAMTGPMLWGPVVLDLFANPVLSADATLVGQLIGTPYRGNVVEFVAGAPAAKAFQVAPRCSSLHGISLALLLWMTLTQALGRRVTRSGLLYCLAAALAVVVINVIRLSLIGLYPAHFESIHGPPGSDIAGWASLLAACAICLYGVRDDLLPKR